MKKNVIFFLTCIFAMTGMIHAQNRGDIQVKAIEMNNATLSQDRLPSDGSWVSYVVDYSEASFIGIGMPFHWGYMFPTDLLTEYKGCSITQFAFLDGGEEQFATTYTLNIYLGGDVAPETMVHTQQFEITGTVGDIVTFMLDTPIEIDGTQNIWFTFYHDGSIRSCRSRCGQAQQPLDRHRWLWLDGCGISHQPGLQLADHGLYRWLRLDQRKRRNHLRLPQPHHRQCEHPCTWHQSRHRDEHSWPSGS